VGVTDGRELSEEGVGEGGGSGVLFPQGGNAGGAAERRVGWGLQVLLVDGVGLLVDGVGLLVVVVVIGIDVVIGGVVVVICGNVVIGITRVAYSRGI
jgi:hypothetical protein